MPIKTTFTKNFNIRFLSLRPYFVSSECLWLYAFHCDVEHWWGTGLLCGPNIYFGIGAALELRVRIRASKTGLNSSVMFPTDLFNKVPLLQLFLCLCVYGFILCGVVFFCSSPPPPPTHTHTRPPPFGASVLRDCSISWVSLLKFLTYGTMQLN